MEKKKRTIEEIKKDAKIYDIVTWLMFFLAVFYILILCYFETELKLIVRVLPLPLLIIPMLGNRQKNVDDVIAMKELRKDLEQHKKVDEENVSNSIIMNWEGQNNVLTDMFRQAKNRGYLTNSIPDIASFLKENFSCFEKTKLSTIETQLKNNTSSANAIPKEEKRIKLDA